MQTIRQTYSTVAILEITEEVRSDKMASAARPLLLKIARCPNVERCFSAPDRPHPCRQVVFAQNHAREEAGISPAKLRQFQVPEPWSGRIETAPILFVSSNPSFNPWEKFPKAWWDADRIDTFFTTRFDFTDLRSTQYWRVVNAIAEELLGRLPRPGHDYALTEVVRCKSIKERGVRQALDKCSGLYLARTLETSGARVLVALGKLARVGVAGHFGLPASEIGVYEGVRLGSRRKGAVLMLGHPSSGERKKPNKKERRIARSNL